MQRSSTSKCHISLRIGTSLMIAVLSACAGDVTAPPEPNQLAGSVTGLYSLRFIDGSRLPVTLCAGEVKVIAGTLRLRSDRTFLASVRFRSPPTAPAQTYQETGSYTREAGTNTIVFQSASRPGASWRGTVLGDGSIRIRYRICGETHVARLFRSL
jgi:hypothetical protein